MEDVNWTLFRDGDPLRLGKRGESVRKPRTSVRQEALRSGVTSRPSEAPFPRKPAGSPVEIFT